MLYSTREINTAIILGLYNFPDIGKIVPRGTLTKGFIMKFYSIKKILQKKAQYNIIYGERSNGKSYAVKKKCLEDFRDSGAQFVYIRRYESDIANTLANRYFADVPMQEIFGDNFNDIYVYANKIFIAKQDSEKRKNVKCVGFVLALSLAQRYSSTAYPNVKNIILEECVSLDGQYLSNELFLFTHIISTIARRRDDVVCWLICNSISRMSPYWREYGVEEIVKTQKQGTIEVVERNTSAGIQRVAIEYCANTEGRSKLFSGLSERMTNQGKWLVNEYPHLSVPHNKREILYIFVVVYKNFKFLVEYVCTLNGYCLVVSPKTTPIKKDTRVITDSADISPLSTVGFYPLSPAEREIFNLFDIGKVFYSDNQTGTEFNEALRNIRRLRLR